MILYLSVEQVLYVHEVQLQHYGGGLGLRDRGPLEAAVARPAMTFGGEDLYPDVITKAAALMHSLVKNHPFVDGNKRVGAHSALIFLTMNGWDVITTDEEIVEITLGVASGSVELEALIIWFRQRARERR